MKHSAASTHLSPRSPHYTVFTSYTVLTNKANYSCLVRLKCCLIFTNSVSFNFFPWKPAFSQAPHTRKSECIQTVDKTTAEVTQAMKLRQKVCFLWAMLWLTSHYRNFRRAALYMGSMVLGVKFRGKDDWIQKSLNAALRQTISLIKIYTGKFSEMDTVSLFSEAASSWRF